MTTKTIISEQSILDKFRVEKKTGPGDYLVYCNVHDDQNNPNCRTTFTPSQVLSYCFACGATGKEQFEAVGLDPKYLFKENWEEYQPEPFSFEGFARAKGLQLKFLKGLGVYEKNGKVIIPYKDRSGELIREKERSAWKATEGSEWIGSGDPATYGKWLLSRMRKKHDYLITCEGETDCWTLWSHKIPALGVPGSTMTKHIKAEDIKGFDKVYFWQEPDKAGSNFVEGCRKRLKQFDYNGRVYLINGQSFAAKDPNELHLLDSEGFKDNMQGIISEAREIDLNSEIKAEDKTNWPDPVPFNNYDSKEIPAEILPDWQEDFAKNLADFTQTPIDMSVLLILSTTATALSNKAVIEVKNGYQEPLNIWTCTVLPPASRKSAVFKKVTQPIIDYEIAQEEKQGPEISMAENEIEIMENRQKKLKQQAVRSNSPAERQDILEEINEIDREIREKSIPKIPRLIANDITPEKIAQLMKGNFGRLALLDSEGTIFKILAGRYTSDSRVCLENINKGWTGSEGLRVDRVSSPSITVKNPAITQGLTVQPRIFEALKQKEAFRGEGTIGRFLYSVPKSNIGNRLTGDEVPGLRQDIFNRYKKGMQVLLNTRPKEEKKEEWEPYILELSPAAREVRNKLAADIEARLGPEGDLYFLREWGGKLVGNVTRVAGLIHIAAQIDTDTGRSDRGIFDKAITGEAMQAARALAEVLIPNAKKLYDLLDSDPKLKLARYILGRIQDGKRKEEAGELPKEKQELDRSALLEMTRDKKEINTPKDLEKTLDLLQELNHIRLEKRSGRKTSLIKLNPKLDTIDPINQISGKSEGGTSIKSGISGQSGKVCKNENELKGVIEI